ncbi:XRE family transcriptional regulator [Pseudomonas sp. MYb118]|uniref:XRE family transcriptional regulator n=1 Tax=Pseudomonas sp. MYb118 TaxID=1848720 RepID=UPI0034CF20ED
MNTTPNDFQNMIATLGELHAVMDRLRGEFVHGIQTPADYERATFLLDELTDGRVLNKVEEKILIELEDEMLAYQRDSKQFRESNAAFEAGCTPVQLIKDLMLTLGLTGSDLPEIGDKTAVSKVLGGDRPISHKMAYALAERFAMQPNAFLAKAAHKPVTRKVAQPAASEAPAAYRPRDTAVAEYAVQEPSAEYQGAAAKTRKRPGKGPRKGE